MKIELPPEDAEKKRKQQESGFNRSRTISDASLIKGDAGYGEDGNLIITEGQRREAVLDEPIAVTLTPRDFLEIPDFNHTIHPRIEALKEVISKHVLDAKAKAEVHRALTELLDIYDKPYSKLGDIKHKFEKERKTLKPVDL